jgi:hypothetical protein
MIRIQARALVCALSICTAPLASAAGNAVDPPPVSVGDATRAEMRHFAIFIRYRAMTDSSGGSGQGSAESAAGTNGAKEPVPGAGAPIVDRFVCAADIPEK